MLTTDTMLDMFGNEINIRFLSMNGLQLNQQRVFVRYQFIR